MPRDRTEIFLVVSLFSFLWGGGLDNFSFTLSKHLHNNSMKRKYTNLIILIVFFGSRSRKEKPFSNYVSCRYIVGVVVSQIFDTREHFILKGLSKIFPIH